LRFHFQISAALPSLLTTNEVCAISTKVSIISSPRYLMSVAPSPFPESRYCRLNSPRITVPLSLLCNMKVSPPPSTLDQKGFLLDNPREGFLDSWFRLIYVDRKKFSISYNRRVPPPNPYSCAPSQGSEITYAQPLGAVGPSFESVSVCDSGAVLGQLLRLHHSHLVEYDIEQGTIPRHPFGESLLQPLGPIHPLPFFFRLTLESHSHRTLSWSLPCSTSRFSVKDSTIFYVTRLSHLLPLSLMGTRQFPFPSPHIFL